MVEYRDTHLDRIFAALADSTRRELMRRLSAGPATVGDLAEPLDMSLNAVSKHLKVLEACGLISREIEGRVHRVYLNAGPLADADQWVDHFRQFWDTRLDSLEAWLARGAAAGDTRKDTS